jgi:predicted ATPase
VLKCGPEELRELRFPESVQGVITSRIDRLPPSQQLTLKVASVIGRTFQFQTLYDAYPVEADRPDLMEHLSVLEALDITPLDSPLPELGYMFKHIITRDVAYDLLLYSQRQQLHGRVAEWYERTYAENLSPHFALLASHWVAAQDHPRALFFLQQAGKLAARSYANREAESFLRQALEQLPSLPEGTARDREELETQLALAPVLLVTQGQGSRDAKRARHHEAVDVIWGDGHVKPVRARKTGQNYKIMDGQTAAHYVVTTAGPYQGMYMLNGIPFRQANGAWGLR